MSCCGNIDCGMGCPRALLGWSAALEERPLTFAEYMALSPKDSEAPAIVFGGRTPAEAERGVPVDFGPVPANPGELRKAVRRAIRRAA